MSDKKINCPFCDSKNCFEEEYHQKISMVQSWMCMRCGYCSLSLYKKHTNELREMLNTSPKLVIDLKKWDDSRQIYWFPSVITIMGKGMLYPDGAQDFWQWNYIPVVKILEEEKEQYRIPGSIGDDEKCFLKHRFAMELTQTFEQYDFKEALKAMGAIVKLDDLKE